MKTIDWLARKFRFFSLKSALLLAGALMLGPGGGLDVSLAGVFPGQGDDTTQSIGVFRITVDPLFRQLLEPTGPPTSYVGYTGYRSADGRLTSPMLTDDAITPTVIGRSGLHSRPNPPPGGVYPYFPVAIGAGSWDSVANYADYPSVPLLFVFAPNNTIEILTEIRKFELKTSGRSDQCTNDPRIPVAPAGIPMVKAGSGLGIAPRSLGMVQENSPTGPGFGGPHFPARSFFDIFVEITLPNLGPTTMSGGAFPPGGAVLTNESPLVITNLNLTDPPGFPPRVVYIHGDTPVAVPVRFKNSWPPFFNAGELFGTLVLAGHGTFTNECISEAALLNDVMGPANGAQKPEMPSEWLRPDPLFPSGGSAYESVPPTATSGEPVIPDVVRFTVPALGVFTVRGLNLGGFPGSIAPPPVNGSAAYSGSNSMLDFQVSVDGFNFYPAQASGPVKVMMNQSNGPSGPILPFNLEMLVLSNKGNSVFGPIWLRESPSKASTGKHTLRGDPRGFRISSFFDVFLELSTDGSQWIPADRAIRMQVNAPPAAPGAIFVARMGSEFALNWLGSFTLQRASSLPGPWTDVPGPVTRGPYYVMPSGTVRQQFFRLRQ